MNSDIVSILSNLSQSMLPVQELLSGLAYLIGIVFVMSSLGRFRKVADMRSSGSQEKMFIPVAYLLIGAGLIFLPTSFTVMTNTLFGTSSNVLQYTEYNPYNVYNAMRLIIRTAGLLWFIRGCVLIAQASEPGTQHGFKGLTFVFAGILAMNFEGSIDALNYVMNHLIAITSSGRNPISTGTGT